MTSEWKRVSERTLYKGRFRQIDERQYEMPNGHTGYFEVEIFTGNTCIVPLLPDGRLIAQRQYRVGQEARLLQMPGGMVDEHEDPLAAAQRELEEETGYTGEFTHLASSPLEAFSTGHRHFYLAENCHLTGKEVQHEPEEDLEVVICTFAEYIEAIKRGEVNIGNIPGVLLALEKLGKLTQYL